MVGVRPDSRMAQNKKKIKSKQGADPDEVLLKKLPRLLALCEFALIPFLVISPSLPIGVAHNNVPENVEKGFAPGRGNEARITSATQSTSKPKEIMPVTVTAYSSTPDQTDDTPFHTANGMNVKDGIVAANFLPLGTKLRIPEAFGEKIFTVFDRMHERFDQRIDIWMPTREAAQEFGIRYLNIEIL